MNLEFDSVRLHRIGREAADRDKQWATVTVRLRDAELDHYYSFELELLVPRRPDVTLRELQEVARETAIPLFRRAADLLEGETIEALEQKEDERRAADAARLQSTFGALSGSDERAD